MTTAPTPPESLFHLIEGKDPTKIEAVEERLKKLSRQDLDAALRKAVIDKSRVRFWLVNEEYLRRNVPPILRKLPPFNWEGRDPSDPDSRNHAMQVDLWAVDLRWVAARYVKHRPKLFRFERMDDYRRVHGVALDAYWHKYDRDKLTSWKVAHEFGLTDEHQRECWTIKKESLRSLHQQCLDKRDEVYVHLRQRAMDRKRVTRISELDDEDLRRIVRQLEVWSAAAMVKWKISKTALFFNARSGCLERNRLAPDAPVSQQRIGTIMRTQVERDVGRTGKFFGA